METTLATVLAGATFGLALIVAIGAQNAHVLRVGLRREHVAVAVALCAGSDLLLIALGTAGLGTVVTSSPVALTTITVLGAAVLILYAVQAARRVVHPEVLVTDTSGARSPARPVVLTTLALTWLNPHVYLDTVVLLGSVSGTYGDGRWWFALGAGLGSVAWFTLLGFGAAVLRGPFSRPTAWRVFDSLIALMMLALAARMLAGLAAH